MRRTILLASISAIGFGYGALAAEQAQVPTLYIAPVAEPSHVKVAQCSPTIRQDLLTIVGNPLVVTFPKGESAWLAPMSGKADPTGQKSVEPSVEGIKPEDLKQQPVKNMITLWPDAPVTTTMTVITQTADGSVKTYPFTLTAIPDGPESLKNPNVTLNLICKAGPVEATSAAATASGTQIQVAHVAATNRRYVSKAEALERLRTDSFNIGDGTCHYHAKGKSPSAIQPMCPMDNGQWTLIRFKGLTAKPAVYVGSCESGHDQERLARQHESGDFVVVEEIAPEFCLRLGSNPNDVLEIFNDHYDPVGNDSGTGTIAPSVQRDLIPAKSQATATSPAEPATDTQPAQRRDLIQAQTPYPTRAPATSVMR